VFLTQRNCLGGRLFSNKANSDGYTENLNLVVQVIFQMDSIPRFQIKGEQLLNKGPIRHTNTFTSISVSNPYKQP
jgi:hypothetical protein